MSWIENIKVSHKLLISYGACILVASLSGILSLGLMASINEKTSEAVKSAMMRSEVLGRLLSDTKVYRLCQMRTCIATKRSDIEKIQGEIVNWGDHASGDLNELATTDRSGSDRAETRQIAQDWATYRSYDNDVAAAAARHDDKHSDDVINKQCRPAWVILRDQGFLMLDKCHARGQTLAASATNTYRHARVLVIGFMVGAILFGLILSSAATRAIVNALKEVSSKIDELDRTSLDDLHKAVTSLAAGDLTVKTTAAPEHIAASGRDEFGDLRRTLNSIVDKVRAMSTDFSSAQDSLAALIGQTARAANEIAGSASQLAAGNEDLSNRTSLQASSLEKTAASMEQITGIVRASADNATRANEISNGARNVAQSGTTIVRDAVDAMTGINQASKRINDIVSVIDEIAFQTNLLALNAAVEAARVGEQGRGFAVVASEVRTLAGRSSTAAKEIKALVRDTVRQVENGAVMVNKSGAHLEEIVDAVKSVAGVVSDITMGANEQRIGIEEVSKSVVDLDHITQQNAALVEEAAAASQHMSQQAAALSEMIQRFRLDSRFAADAPDQGDKYRRAA
ncbi:MAG: methyl-accepting chemotaxis protein [Capsulimonadaceae bacterium]|nr:methyl-accepting chemotaxis protein [Capsulimonadaceae bacterium]